jgi:hypothetical protein
VTLFNLEYSHIPSPEIVEYNSSWIENRRKSRVKCQFCATLSRGIAELKRGRIHDFSAPFLPMIS